MDGYGYHRGGYTTCNWWDTRTNDWSQTNHSGNGYQRGGYTTRNGWDTRTDDWSQKNYFRNGYSDHVHHPVIVSAQGRERLAESYVTQTETVIEHDQVPVVTEYKYSSPTEVESFNDYRVKNDKWRWPKSTLVVQDHPQKVEVYVQTLIPTKYTYSSPTKVEPFKEYRVNNNNNKLLDCKQKVEEFIAKILTEVNQQTWPDLSPTYWRDTPNSTSSNGNTGYGGYKNFSNSEKPDEYYPNKNNTFTDPTLNNKDGRDRPSSKGWAMQPPSPPLSKPTNDTGTVVELLKEAVISTTQPRFGIQVLAVPKKDPYIETNDVEYSRPQRVVKPATVTFPAPPPSTVHQKKPYGDIIDSGEAARQYGNSNNSSARPYNTEESYTEVIDSREAAKKYGGTLV